MSVSIWQHVLVVLTLLGTNAATFFIAKRRIEGLQMALVAKKVLLNEKVVTGTERRTLLPDETLSLRRIPANRIDIKVSAAVTLDLVYSR